MRTKTSRWAAIVTVLGVLIGLSLQAPLRAEALSGADFDPGYIISDQQFFDSASMNATDVQNFFNAKEPTCAMAYGNPCLRYFTMGTYTRAANAQCGAYQGGPSEPAAVVLTKVAQACGISPKVLIVLLEKEQGLVTSGSPTTYMINAATGYACPDTAPCDSQYYGFYNQVYRAAWQFKEYSIHPSSWRYRIGNVAIQYYPSSRPNCKAPVVNVQNQATANLYNYTPYQPNGAALANLRGGGDECSSYGNRNFWVFFNDWFGSPTYSDVGNPVASLDVFSASPGSIRVAGWAFDPDTSASIPVAIYINGTGYQIIASNNRPDVGATWPSLGPLHGFDATFPMSGEGPQTVCVYGSNVALPGSNKLFACQTFPGLTGSAAGVVDSMYAAGGQLNVTGWAYDPDTAASSLVAVYVDSTGYMFSADQDRSDFAAGYPGYGAKHGYSRSFAVSPGTHNVCVYAIDVAGQGANRLITCRTITMSSGSPFGALDYVAAGPGTYTVAGWAFDPDSTTSSPVHVYVDGIGTAITADLSRSDIAAAYPGYGDKHGYAATVPATPGVHNVCTYGIDIAAPGANRQLGCRQVAAMSGNPVGVIDYVGTTSDGKISAGGWAYDPDTAQPIPVHVYVDSSGYAFTADQTRPDVGAVYPAYGSDHGYSVTAPATKGTHNVCIYGINIGAGGNQLLGCRTVTL
jgi:hypothetical protein